ncbi:phospholipid carrier-dependent glycosyltransferase [Conexibacter sp. W3-3-2]|uniref:glycosyltransferase family 39 protein n=1 Tax=Conexibacter sp. W3-3-2 TaxID=2675227 RepID=UPI0012B7A5C7|nr:glycosyltransferase family 39 protein [Conexibacter sp. W3-3-2]MTD44291.1 phospholipid carrier-dependent glycosyltransferase [Conexibacter sp. W3-3-2]
MLAWARRRPELLALLVLAAVLNLWGLDRNGFANEYYAAGVRSMTESWHAFLYGSFDAAGVMTVDKPPLALWIQAASAKVLGFNSWGLLVPQALMGVASVALVYDLTRRTFGRGAGFAAGLVMATTPVIVAVSRHNNPDALLVLCSVAALWFLVRGLQDGATRWLVLAGVAVGLGFEAKMAAALMVVPGIAAAWMWVAPRGRLAAVRQLLAGGAAMAVVGLAWPVLVWLTPAADRPWVSGTSDNSIWSLILGYNGLGRLFGQDGGPGGGAGGPGGGGPGGGVFGGEPGALRLLNDALGGQGGWMLGFALVAGVAVLVSSRLRRSDARTGWLVAIGGAFLVTAVAFSRAEGIFHPYYVSLLAPFTAALVGAGVGQMVRDRGTAMRILGPLMIAGGIATELVVLGDVDGQFGRLPPVLVAAGVVVSALLAFGVPRKVRAIAVATVLGALLLAPATWAFQTLGHATSGTFPAGGPAGVGMGMGGPGGPGGMRGGPGGPGGMRPSGPPPAGAFPGAPPAGVAPSGAPGGTAATPATPSGTTGGTAPGTPGTRTGGGPFGGNAQSLTAAVAYAKTHGGGTVAVASQSGAAGSLISSGADVAAIGGFSGRESQVTVAWLADAVERGQIRYVLADSSGGGMRNDGRVGASDVLAVAAQVGTPVSSVDGLYDLQGLADALRAAA